jgi:hypothetical protein
MKHLFFFKKTNEDTKKEYWHSFNVNRVVRTEQFGDHHVVLLDDGHEQSFDLPWPAGYVPKKGEEPKRKREFMVSQIEITEEDMTRLRALYELS